MKNEYSLTLIIDFLDIVEFQILNNPAFICLIFNGIALNIRWSKHD